MVRTARPITARASRSKKAPMPAAKPVARVAMVPAKMAKKLSQPTRKPASGWKASRR
jgi:hypothetical protein